MKIKVFIRHFCLIAIDDILRSPPASAAECEELPNQKFYSDSILLVNILYKVFCFYKTKYHGPFISFYNISK